MVPTIVTATRAKSERTLLALSLTIAPPMATARSRLPILFVGRATLFAPVVAVGIIFFVLLHKIGGASGI